MARAGNGPAAGGSVAGHTLVQTGVTLLRNVSSSEGRISLAVVMPVQ